MINVKVKTNKGENNLNLLRRFSKRVQGAGILGKAKSIRFNERQKSSFIKKKNRLRSIKKRAQIEKMIKRGLTPKKKKRRF